MNNIGMDADSNSWGSDYDQGEEYGSEFSDTEFPLSHMGGGSGGPASSSAQHQFHTNQAGRAASKSKGGANSRKTVNRGRWTKDEVSTHFPAQCGTGRRRMTRMPLSQFVFFSGLDSIVTMSLPLNPLVHLGRKAQRCCGAQWRSLGDGGFLFRGPHRRTMPTPLDQSC